MTLGDSKKESDMTDAIHHLRSAGKLAGAGLVAVLCPGSAFSPAFAGRAAELGA